MIARHAAGNSDARCPCDKPPKAVPHRPTRTPQLAQISLILAWGTRRNVDSLHIVALNSSPFSSLLRSEIHGVREGPLEITLLPS
jgi:hypothetical protein